MNSPIGLFDSGIGGLTVRREILRALPAESTIYVADQAHLPYGPRPAAEVRAYAEAITAHLVERGCKAIVVACNTASAAALKFLREARPELLFVGMEPAVKPAAAHSRTRVVGVMATPGTLQGRMFALAVERFAGGVTLVNQPCPGLVEAIEAGELESEATEALLRELLKPILGAGADTLVLACTHYPMVAPLIRKIAGEALHIVDPAPAVARHLSRSLQERNTLAAAGAPVRHEFLTTGSAAALAASVRQFAGPAACGELRWRDGQLVAATAGVAA